MKSILVSVALAFSFQSFASTSAVLCKTSSGKIQNLLSGEWDSCADALYTGDVCFVGKRSEVIDIINSDEVRNKYDGTDGEYVKGAHRLSGAARQIRRQPGVSGIPGPV